MPIDFDEVGADLMSVSAHKLGGPAGVGALLVRRGLRVPPLIVGGDQERARRGGLENVAGAVGFGAVATGLAADHDAEAGRAATHIDALRRAVTAVPGVTVYGPEEPARRLPHLLCVGVDGVEAEPVLIGLDRAGVAAHSGSSCSSESLEPSPVLEAMGVDGERSLRFSVGWSTTDPRMWRWPGRPSPGRGRFARVAPMAGGCAAWAARGPWGDLVSRPVRRSWPARAASDSASACAR